MHSGRNKKKLEKYQTDRQELAEQNWQKWCSNAEETLEERSNNIFVHFLCY